MTRSFIFLNVSQSHEIFSQNFLLLPCKQVVCYPQNECRQPPCSSDQSYMCIPPTSPGFLNAECAICVKTHITGSILYLLNLLLPSTYIWLKAPPNIFSFSAASRYFPSVKNASAAWCTIVHSDTPAGLPLPSCESLNTRHEKYD